MNWRRAALAYFSLQGVAAALWWVALGSNHGGPFTIIDLPEWMFRSLALADVLLFACGSLVVAASIAWNARCWYMLLCIQAGASMYAALLTIGLALFANSGWLGAGLMLPALVIPPLLAWKLHGSERRL